LALTALLRILASPTDIIIAAGVFGAADRQQELT